MSAVKHQPASPLPWSVEDGENSYLAVFGAPTNKRDRVGLALFGLDRDYNMPVGSEAADARYLAHAANAYPKLVEALRLAVREAEQVDTVGGQPLLNIRLSDRDTRALMALLRDIGEEA